MDSNHFSRLEYLGVEIIITVQLQSTKSEFSFCLGLNPIGGESLLPDGKNFRQDFARFVGQPFCNNIFYHKINFQETSNIFLILKVSCLKYQNLLWYSFPQSCKCVLLGMRIFFQTEFWVSRRVRTITSRSGMFLMIQNLLPTCLIKMSRKRSLCCYLGVENPKVIICFSDTSMKLVSFQWSAVWRKDAVCFSNVEKFNFCVLHGYVRTDQYRNSALSSTLELRKV